MGGFSLRRVFRVLWALCAIALVAGLPALVIDFKRNEYSVHYQVIPRNSSIQGDISYLILYKHGS